MITQQPKDFIPSKAVYPCIVAPKLDGVRGRTIDGLMYSRRRKRILGMSHIEGQLRSFSSPFDGELTVSGEGFDSASGLIRNHQETPNAVFNIFDIPRNTLSKNERLLHLKMIIPPIESDTVKLVPTFWVNSYIELMEYYYQFLSDGHEGLVYYDPLSKYEKKKNHKWMRLVPLKSADCEVVGFVRGDGKNLGSLGAILVDYNGKECKVGTGFKEIFEGNEKEYVRQYIWDNRELFRGAIAECVFKEETKAGKMRQPRFKGWRWDKTKLPTFE